MDKQSELRITRSDISFQNIKEINRVLRFILTDWVDNACFNSKSIGVYLFTDYKKLDKYLIDKDIKPFIMLVPEREGNPTPAGANKTHIIELGSCKKNALIVGTIQQVIGNFILNERFLEKQIMKFEEAYGHLRKLGQGDGLFKVLRVQADNDYYFNFLSVSLDYY